MSNSIFTINAEEALAAIGIERTYTDAHYSEHF